MAFENSNAALDISALPPMLKEYQEVKSRHPDCVVFFQVGDFYEVFFEDAVTVARALNLTLTSRDKNNANPIPMCGVPVAALDSYLERLLELNFSAAVVAQQNSYSNTRWPALLKDENVAGKAVIQRKLTRIVTPGIRLLSNAAGPAAANLVAAVLFDQQRQEGALAFSDVQTGKIQACDGLGLLELQAEISRLMPREIILPLNLEGRKVDRRNPWVKRLERKACGALIKFRSLQHSSLAARRALSDIPGYSALGVMAQKSVALLLDYIDETIVDGRLRIVEIGSISEEQTLAIDATTRDNLELVKNARDGSTAATLLWVLNHTKTPAGERLLRQWLVQPLRVVEQIQRRQDAVAELLNKAQERLKIGQALEGIPDLERLAARLELGMITPRELGEVRAALKKVPLIQESLLPCVFLDSRGQPGLLAEIRDSLQVPPEMLDLLARALVDEPPFSVNEGGIIRQGFAPDLDHLREIKGAGRSWMAQLEADERARTGINSLRIKFNYVLGFFIEVTRPNLSRVPDNYIRRQSTANAERFTTSELRSREAEVLGAEERAVEMEKGLFEQLRRELLGWAGDLRRLAGALALLDVLYSLAETAECEGYVRPIIDNSRELYIKKGKHPVLAKILQGRYVPNSLHMTPSCKMCWLVGGPNMGGKSTYLRQAGLIVILAQIGSYVPAKEARLGVVDKIFARIGASDNLAEGESTFMVEMREAAHIVQGATERSLLLVDEIGRGTATSDGLAIAQAVLEWIVCKIHCRTLFATHFHELSGLAKYFREIGNLSVGSVQEGDDVIFTHEIQERPANKSYGIEVAKLAGLPAPLLARARAILGAYEGGKKELILEPPPGDVDSGQLSLFSESAPSGLKAQEGVASSLRPIRRAVLFSSLMQKLKAVDIDNFTPLQALNFLQDIKTEIKENGSFEDEA